LLEAALDKLGDDNMGMHLSAGMGSLKSSRRGTMLPNAVTSMLRRFDSQSMRSPPSTSPPGPLSPNRYLMGLASHGGNDLQLRAQAAIDKGRSDGQEERPKRVATTEKVPSRTSSGRYLQR
jgi:hypothetical protein